RAERARSNAIQSSYSTVRPRAAGGSFTPSLSFSRAARWRSVGSFFDSRIAAGSACFVDLERFITTSVDACLCEQQRQNPVARRDWARSEKTPSYREKTPAIGRGSQRFLICCLNTHAQRRGL